MTATDPACDGTFDILDNLPDKIRPKYVDKLTRDQMAQVILSVWRERDAAKADAEKQLTSKLRPVSDASASCKSQAPILRSGANSSAIDTSAKGTKHTRVEKRPMATETSLALSRKVAKKISTSANGEHDLCDLPRSKDKTDEASRKNTRAETEDPETFSTKVEETAIRPEKDFTPPIADENQTRHLPLMLSLKKEDESTDYKNIQELPSTVLSELRMRFADRSTGNKSRIIAYNRLLGSLAKYSERQSCVCDQIFKNLKATRKGIPILSQTFVKGGRLGVSADDKCIDERMPCVHLVRKQKAGEDEYILVIVPLPEQLRGNAKWTELKFWVVE
ncbi:hypothetical protein HBI23_063500 [Parastagonospora nodorum]|nr:hypothetical protein HBI23_063500 [Parastagonospora nodorum]